MIIKYFEFEKINIKKTNFILLHGKNEGLKNQEINKLKNKISKKTKNYDEKQILENTDRFIEDLMNGSLFDESKIIIINRASDKLFHTIEDLIERKIEDTIFIFNCEILEKKSKIRNLFEKSKDKLISIAFYPDNYETLSKLAQSFIRSEKISLSNENLNLIINKCNNDRKNLLNELEKVSIFSKTKKNITNEEIQKLVNLNENHSVNELINFCLAKNKKQTLNILNENNYSNEDVIIIIRTMLKKTKTLLNLILQFKINKDLNITINNSKPPIFWKEKEIVKLQIKAWSLDKVKDLIREINDLELLLKKRPIKPINFISNFLIEKSS